ncbi:hypothetical protein [Rhodobacter lacus]|uniref:Uncharacterized protein n=1 Tax=Rhodobacter lacus TaxID=1641972 RepID=A0ABW5A4X9_9RHOB
MRQKDLKALQELAAMVRDREMGKLARLTTARQKLEAQHAEVGVQAGAARREGMEDLLLSGAAERFTAWSLAKQAQLTQQIAALQEPIAFQTAKTAKAVGRNENLGKIAETLKTEALKKAANKL